MPDSTKKITPVNYLNKDFVGIRSDLLDLVQRYYPDQFQDFSESSFGAMMIDAVAYVGDQISLYMDYNINESFLDTAFEFFNNTLSHSSHVTTKKPKIESLRSKKFAHPSEESE